MPFTESSPRLVPEAELRSLFEPDGLEALTRVALRTRYPVGEEYGQYLTTRFSAGLAVDKILSDEGRFTGSLSVNEFFVSQGNQKASTSFINPASVFFARSETIWDVRGFPGKAGDSSCLHFDWNLCDNIILNISGTKRYTFFSPSRSSVLRGFANIAEETGLASEVSLTLGAGDALLIPPLWWHQAHYLTDAFSLSIRFRPSVELGECMRGLYPSWKIVQLLSEGRLDALELSTAADAAQIYALVEEYSDRLLGWSESANHPHYASWSLGYLGHYARAMRAHLSR